MHRATRGVAARSRWAAAVAAFVAAVVAAGATEALAHGHGTRGKYAGMVVGTAPDRVHPAGELARIKETGASTVAFTVVWEADEVTSSVYRGAEAPNDNRLESALRQARALGLRIVLEPMLRCRTCRPAWRGAIRPLDPAAFFRSYRTMINHYASVAQAHGVEVFFAGTEMSTLQGYGDEWREVIRQVRGRFKGRVAYEANHDAFLDVGFWDAVDVIGVSAYFPLTDTPGPSVEELRAAWHAPRPGTIAPQGWYRALEDLSARTGRPVMFGEVGYRSVDRTAHRPWTLDEAGAFNPQAQVNAYRALLEVFEPQPWWLGVLWWEWLVTGGEDVGFTPRDKLAEELLTRWWGQGWRPGDASPSAGADAAPQPAARVSPGRTGPGTAGSVPPPADLGSLPDDPPPAGAVHEEVLEDETAAPEEGTVARGRIELDDEQAPPGTNGVGVAAALLSVGAMAAVTATVRRVRAGERSRPLPD